MRTRPRSFTPVVFFIVPFVVLGCLPNDDDVQAMAAPTATGIPIGAPGAIGAHIDTAATASLPLPQRPEGIEQKINPGPGAEPPIPPSPFGSPSDDDPPTEPTKKTKKGTKI